MSSTKHIPRQAHSVLDAAHLHASPDWALHQTRPPQGTMADAIMQMMQKNLTQEWITHFHG